MEKIKLGETLSELRAVKGVTQEAVAAALAVSNKTVSKWENGDSFPDLQTLAELAEYFGVSTDRLLGRASGPQGTDSLIAEEFKGLDRRKTALKLLEMLRATFPPCMSAAGIGADEACGSTDTIPPHTDPLNKYSVSHPELFHFLVCSDDVNLAVLQLRNQANFNWLLDEKKQERMADFLSFLADPDTMRVLYFLHSADCSENFTAEYMAKNTSVDPARVTDILKRCCRFGICEAVTAHLKTGTKEIYKSFGDGLTLSLLSLTYERTCGQKYYNYCFNDSGKMIAGVKNESFR